MRWLTYRQEEVRDVVSDIHREANVSEMKPIAQRDERQRDDVMPHKLFEIFSGLLQLQHKDDSLLGPVASLEQVISLEKALMLPVGEAFKHRGRVEVPNVGATHDIETKRAEYGKVDGRIHLLHEPSRFAFSANPTIYGERTDQALHEEFTSEREHDCIEGAK